MKFNARHLNASRFCIKITLSLLLLVVICSIIVLSWVPPVSRDALTHHLAVPKLYLQQGGIHEIPSIIFSYYPMNLDLLYMVPLYFGNDIVPKFIHFVFALLTTWLVFTYLRKRLDTVWAGGGALFFLSLPIIVKLSITVYVDLGLVFFSTASLMGLFKWIESRFQLKYLILAAFFCGLALGVKYNGLIVLFLLTLFVPLLYKQQAKPGAAEKKVISLKGSLNRQLRAIGWGALFCLIALMVFSPWMIRNYIWKDNPVYPLYNSFFNPQKIAMAPGPVAGVQPDAEEDIISPENKIKSSSWGPFAIRKVVYGEAWWEIALIPVRIFFQGRDDDPRYFDGKLNPFLFLLPIFAFFQLKMNPDDVKVEKKFLFSFAILFILYAYFKTDMRIRYIAPAIPPLVILSTFGLYQIHKFIARQWSPVRRQGAQIAMVVLAAVIFIFNAPYIIHQFKLVDPFSYISGRVGRDAYITRYRPEYTIIQYANTHIAANAKLLVLFMGNRRYYSDRELIFGNNLFLKSVKKVGSAQAILNDLQKRGFTHLLIRYDLFNKWTDKQFSDREKKMLKVFFARDVKPLLSKNGYGLFELQFIQ
jgi:4-amino-4-deoxy-L-arabinose transferase-like glycosyltransferase